MDLTLCLGFTCIVYKTPPTIRIFVNDFFVDEFELHATVRKKDVSTFYKSVSQIKQKTTTISELDPKIIYPQKDIDSNISLKFYDLKNISSNNKNKCNITIEVKNQDNNYTNGFSTQSTLLSFPIVLLTSTKIIANFKSFYRRFLSKTQRIRGAQKKAKDIKKYYINKKFITPIVDQSFSFYDSKSKKNVDSWLFGGDGKFKFDFYKKYNTTVPDSKIGFKRIGQGDAEHLLAISDKYSQYANLRDTN